MTRTTLFDNDWQILELEPGGPLTDRDIAELAGSANPDSWLPVQCLDQVHPLLLEAGRIADPHEPGNVNACLWVGERDWVYRRLFTAPKSTGRHYLHFKGLDTLVDIYLNGKKLAEHRDCFLPLELDVTEFLADKNVLLLHFYSPHDWMRRHPKPQESRGGYPIAPNRYLRKPHEDFNGFNGARPYFTKIGPYDDIELISFEQARIHEFDCRTALDSKASAGRVAVSLSAEVLTDKALEAEVRLLSPEGDIVCKDLVELSRDGDFSRAELEMKVGEPGLWWPRGFGAQPLYTLELKLRCGGAECDIASKAVGFRTIRFDGDFALWVNGRRIRMWGVNLTPFEGISHRHYGGRMCRILDLAEEANCVLIRAWGPGAPWHEELFVEADRRGLLVWGELFHTWGPYPEDEELRGLCIREAETYIRKLKHHPSIICWCGGNEVYMGCGQMHPDKPMPSRRLFEEDYRSVCARLDPGRLYHPSSPSGGSFPNSADGGDSHAYTHHWYVPGIRYAALLTENARRILPPMHSMKRMLGDALWDPGHIAGILPKSEGVEAENWGQYLGRRSETGNVSMYPPGWADAFEEFSPGFAGPLGDFYEFNDTPEGLHYRICAAGTKWLQDCVESLRRGRPFWDPAPRRRSNGHFYWVFNSTWPKFGWHAVDYFMEPTCHFYALRRAYAPILLSIEVDDHIYLWLVNDTAEELRGEAVFQLRDADGTDILKEIRRRVSIAPDRSEIVTDGDAFGSFWRSSLLVAEFIDEDGQSLARTHAIAWRENQRETTYPDARLELRKVGRDIIEISTDRFARWVEMRGDADGDVFGWCFEDNYFDLLPGEKKQIRLLGRQSRGVITAQSFFSPHKASLDF